MPQLTKKGYLTPMAAIRAKCMDCVCWQQAEVRLCTATKCPLHPYRMGCSPGTVRDSQVAQTMQKFSPGRELLGNNLEGYPDITPDGESGKSAPRREFIAKEATP